MDLSKRANTRSRAIIRQRVSDERAIQREIERNSEAYREKMMQVFATASKDERPRCILAEGDSWFRYVVGFGAMYFVDKRKRNYVNNIAWPGDEVRDMLTPKNAKMLAKELRRGPTRGRKYDAFCFSGGGNDLLGQQRFRLWLHEYEEDMGASDVINKESLEPMIRYLRNRYMDVIAIRNLNSPKTRMYLQEYDFAQPNGDGVCGTGPWLQPGLIERGVPNKDGLREDVVAEFLKIFRRMLQRVVRESADTNTAEVVLVNTQGTLASREWDNEIHPKKGGFKKIGIKIAEAIESDLP